MNGRKRCLPITCSPLTYSPFILVLRFLGDAVLSPLPPRGETQERQAQARQGQGGRLGSRGRRTWIAATTATAAATRRRRHVHMGADAARVGASGRSGRRVAGH